MNLIEKLIEQREKERDEARDLARQKERYIASKLIRYVIDKKGRKVSVQIDLTKHRQLGEHIEQFLVSRALREAAECAESTPKRRRRRVLKRRPAKPARGA
jgi:hypothetical protein